MGSTEYRDEGWLREKYHAEGLTLDEMGELCGVTNTTISDWMDRHGIEKLGRREAQRISGKHTDREWLAEQYHGKKRTLADIADECDVGPVTVMNWMERHNIPRREATRHKRVSPARYYMPPDNPYPVVASKCQGEFRQAKVHQLVAIADGADPDKVFSDGEYQCHHRNGVPWDNRPENIGVLSATEHADEHWPDRERAPTGEFL